MFRLANDAFIENNELYTLATYCLTETIKLHLGHYFLEGYKNEVNETLYTKVDKDAALELFPEELIDGMINVMGLKNVPLFIYKKIAQFMQLLNNTKEKTPDIFIEYILYRIIQQYLEMKVYFTSNNVMDKKVTLKSLLRTYAKDELEIIDVKERNKYVKDNMILLTEFTSLNGIEGSEQDSLTFWDYDFSYFDEWEFEDVIKELAYGDLGLQRGYGLNYTKSLFTDVGEKAPLIINNIIKFKPRL